MAGPWEKYATQPAAPAPAAPATPPAPAGPWDRFGRQAPAPQVSNDGYASDMWNSAGAGLRRGTEFLIGMPGDVNDFTQRTASRVSRALFGDRITNEIRDQMPMGLRSTGVMTPDVQAVTQQYLGPTYEPKTRPGRYTRSVAEQVPGAVVGPGGLWGKLATAFFGGIGSEAGGELGAKFGHETAGRVIGGLAGGAAGAYGSNYLAGGPGPREAAREANVATMQREGVPLTAGQQTGSNFAKNLESELGGGSYADMLDAQKSAFTDATMRRLGEAGGPALDENLAAARARIGGTFDQLAASTAVPFDQQLQNDLLSSATLYHEAAPQVAPVVDNLMNRMGEMAARNGGVLAGDNYQSLMSTMGKVAKSADPATSEALMGFRNALDDAVERSLSGGQLQAWQDARRQYANLLTVNRTMTGAGVEAANGMIDPGRLRTSISSGGNGPAAIAEGRANLTDLANAGVSTMKDMPGNSGTAGRLAARAIPAAAGAALASSDPLSALGAGVAGGIVGPWLMGKAVMGPLGQSALLGPSRDQRLLLAAMMAAKQAQAGGQ